MKKTITINGKTYPYRQTMGALLRFKRETGKEISEISNGNMSDAITFLWCCVASACKHDNVEFDLTLIDFADSLNAEDINLIFQSEDKDNNDPNDAAQDSEKKSLSE